MAFTPKQCQDIYGAIEKRRKQLIDEHVILMLKNTVFNKNACEYYASKLTNEIIPSADTIEWITLPVFRIESLVFNSITTSQERKESFRKENIPMVEMFGDEIQLHHCITKNVLNALEDFVKPDFIIRYSCSEETNKGLYTILTYTMSIVLIL